MKESPFVKDLQRAADRVIAFIKSRTSDHWLMFAAGLVLGLLIG